MPKIVFENMMRSATLRHLKEALSYAESEAKLNDLDSGLRPRFKHTFDIAFTVNSFESEGEDVRTPTSLAALLRRVIACVENEEFLEAVDAPTSTVDVDDFDLADFPDKYIPIRKWFNERGRKFPDRQDGVLTDEDYIKAGLPVVVSCWNCTDTMKLTGDLMMSEDGRVYCPECVNEIKETEDILDKTLETFED